MREMLRDPEMMTGVLRRRVLRAMVPAIKKLDRIARGRARFRDDHERLACVVLARLAPVVLAIASDDEREEDIFSDPMWSTPEKIESLNRLMEPSTREQNGESWVGDFLKGSSMPVGIDTVEKAREYGRTRWDHCEASRIEAEKKIERRRRR